MRLELHAGYGHADLFHQEQAARLKADGRLIGGNDLWIASHSLAEEATLVTSNVGEFRRIQGLQVEDWAGR
ncbi:MAG: hypothetical protein ACK5T2_09120 [bacterium]|jgi:tRNA(fMet)-specific endonuclease VapC|nr:hypothetical protein [Rhodocyclaceae bacterium]